MESSVKSGMLRKKGMRMYQWSTRYFILTDSSLNYKLKMEDIELRGQFPLLPGCIVTDIEEDTAGLQGKRVYSFWVVWPQDRTQGVDGDGYESTEEEGGINGKGNKDLKKIVTHEAKAQKEAKKQVEEQIELHTTHDRHVSLGVKVAAAVAGGVVIGASTAGVGLIPYMVVVGTAIGAGAAGAVGGAAWSSSGGTGKLYKHSRLVLGCESREEAKEWKAAIEHQVASLERRKKAQLPSDMNPLLIMGMLETIRFGQWRRVQTVEGARIMERVDPPEGVRSRRVQVVVRSAPVETFLTLMETPSPFWPSGGNLDGEVKVLKVIDDHADIIRLAIKKPCSAGLLGPCKDGFQIEVILHRFWKHDDDGMYLITYSSTGQTQFYSTGSNDVPSHVTSELDLHVVVTVSPRKDHNEFDDDLPESLVMYTCQLSERGWAKAQLEVFLNMLLQQVIDLQAHFLSQSFARFEAGQAVDPRFTFAAVYEADGSGGSVGRKGGHIKPIFTKIEPPASVQPASLLRSFSLDSSQPLTEPNNTEVKSPRRGFFRSAPAAPEKLERVNSADKDDRLMVFEDDRTRKRYSSEIKGKIASLEYEIKREEKRLTSRPKEHGSLNATMNTSYNDDSEALVERRQEMKQLKETFRQASGKEYDRVSKVRLRGLRKFTSRTFLRRLSKDKSSQPLVRQSSEETPTDEFTSLWRDFKYVPRRVPQRWGECYCDSWIMENCVLGSVALAAVGLCIYLTLYLECCLQYLPF